MIATDNFEKVEVASSLELREWLSQHHHQIQSVWLVTFKKSVPEKYLSTADVLDELLCFGWIDGIRRKLDENRTMQLISPRKSQHWAGTYKSRAANLIAEGRMQEAGFQAMARSKEEGLWDFMDDVDKLFVPEDLMEVLNRYEGAIEFFQSINPSSKRFVLRWIKLAKTAKVRESRLIKISTLASKGQKLEGS
jgi:uncharacterized protein YdeI (YjbR/CyaY-like superfamily)